MKVIALHCIRGLLLVAAIGGIASPAAAGCLMDYDNCSGCAQGLLWEGVRQMSPSKVREAHLYQADCAIDLWHCMMFDNHHSYACPV